MPPGAIVAVSFGLGIIFAMMFLSFIAAARIMEDDE